MHTENEHSQQYRYEYGNCLHVSCSLAKMRVCSMSMVLYGSCFALFLMNVPALLLVFRIYSRPAG